MGANAEIKGLKKLDKAFNKFTQSFGVKATLAEEFEAYVGTNEIGYTIFCSDLCNEFFLENAEARYPEIRADIGLWLLMHEIGHIKTWDMWSKDEQEYFRQYTDEEIPEIEDDATRYRTYHNAPIEYMATKWAGDTMMREPAKIAKRWRKLQKAMMEFYRVNNLIN